MISRDGYQADYIRFRLAKARCQDVKDTSARNPSIRSETVPHSLPIQQSRVNMAWIGLLAASAPFVNAGSTVNEAAFAPEEIIRKYVAIIGGGASGTYAAVRLREDYNTSIIVIEEMDRLVRYSSSPSRLRSLTD